MMKRRPGRGLAEAAIYLAGRRLTGAGVYGVQAIITENREKIAERGRNLNEGARMRLNQIVQDDLPRLLDKVQHEPGETACQ